MQDNDRSGSHIAQNIPGRKIHRMKLRVVGVNRADDTMVVIRPYLLQHPHTVKPRTRPEPPHRPKRRNQLMSLGQLALKFFRRQRDAALVTHQVIAQLVAIMHNPPHHIFISRYLPANDKEGRRHVIFGQQIENLRR